MIVFSSFATHHVCIKYLHAHEEVGGLPPVEAAVGELPADPVHLGALLRRAKVRVELPHCPSNEAVGRPQPWPAPRHLQPPHADGSDGRLLAAASR